jgi:hypothetical protein
MMDIVKKKIKSLAFDIFNNAENGTSAKDSHDELIDMIDDVASDLQNGVYQFVDINSIALKPTNEQIWIDKIELLFTDLFKANPDVISEIKDIIESEYIEWTTNHCRNTGLPKAECNCWECQEEALELHQNELFDQGKLIYI